MRRAGGNAAMGAVNGQSSATYPARKDPAADEKMSWRVRREGARRKGGEERKAAAALILIFCQRD